MAISVMVFGLGWSLRYQPDNSHTIILAVTFLAVALLDFAHTQTYTGMPDFFGHGGPERAINFWLSGRAIAAFGLLAVAVLPLRTWPPFACYAGIAVSVAVCAASWWVGFLHDEWLPRTFIEGQGLTSFKVGIEFALSALYFVAAASLFWRGLRRRSNDLYWLAAACWVLGLAEWYFTLYASVSDLFNVLGHVYKAVAYLMLYRALFVAGVLTPYRLLADTSRLLAQERARLRSLIDSIPDFICFKDVNSAYLGFNTAFAAYCARSESEMIGKTEFPHASSDQAEACLAEERAVLASSEPRYYEELRSFPDGRSVPLETLKTPYFGPSGEILGLICVSRDISKRKQAEQQLAQRTKELLEKQYAIDQAVIVTITDLAGKIVHVNDNFCQVSGYSRDELVGNNHRLLRTGLHSAAFFKDIRDLITTGAVWRGEICNQTKDGSLYWLDTTIVPQRGGDGMPIAYMAICIDITARKLADAKISYMAKHDPLTGLGNRAILNDKLDEALARSRRRQETFAVLLLDLDGFKHINDTLGHAAGDELLKELAVRLQSSLRDADFLARLGGDEFAIIQGHAAEQREAAVVLARKILEIVAAPFTLDGHSMTIGTSIGIAVAPGDGDSAGELLQKADLAMYRSKAEGRNIHRFFDQEMSKDAAARLQLVNHLRTALEHQEFELHYQPIFDTKTRRPCGAEALVRWRHPVEGLIPPDRFIRSPKRPA